jgi:hypothetical protein
MSCTDWAKVRVEIEEARASLAENNASMKASIEEIRYQLLWYRENSPVHPPKRQGPVS